MENRIRFEHELIIKQQEICTKYGAPYLAAPLDKIIGIAIQTLNLWPVNGLRHPIEYEHSSNWYIWGGEAFSQAADFFHPTHIYHLSEMAPRVLHYLGLAPGWRFLFDNDYDDVWFDETLLKI